jgi:hypothetical protein
MPSLVARNTVPPMERKWDDVPTMWFAATCWVGAVTVGGLAVVSGVALLLEIGDPSARYFVFTLALALGLATLGGISYGLGRLIVWWSDKAAHVRSIHRLHDEMPELFPDPPSKRDERIVSLGRVAGWLVGCAMVLLIVAGFASCLVRE